ncbi:MAG: hypothetical protein ACOCZ5_02345 [bacterium]
MQFTIDPKDTINSINQGLHTFITKDWDEEDTLDVYCVFDYNRVNEFFKEYFPNDQIPYKPIIHLWENPIRNDNKVISINGKKGETLYCSYDVFIVIDENIPDTERKKNILNRLASELKYKIDNYANRELGFKNISLTMSEGYSGKNADNLYSIKQRLSFRVFREMNS